MRDILTPLFRRRRLLILTFCGVFLGAIVAAFLLSSQYEASMEILVNRDRMDPVVTAEQFSQTTPVAPPLTEEDINSEVELLQSADLLQKVVVANKLQDKEKDSILAKLTPKKDEAYYVSEAVKHLGKKLKVEAVKKTNMIQVTYQSSNPQLAYGVLNTLSNVYLEKHVSVHRPVGAYDFFAKETDRYQKALQDSEVRLANFGSDGRNRCSGCRPHRYGSTGCDLHCSASSSSASHLRRRTAHSRRGSPTQGDACKINYHAGVQSAEVLLQQLQANLLAAQLKRTQLAMKYDSSYPLVKEADQEIAETQAAIAEAQKTQYMNQTTDRDPTYEYLREDVAKTKADLASQHATAAAVGRSIDSMKAQLVDLDQKTVKQSDLLRDTKANEANYLLYLSKREQEQTSDALDLKRIANVAIAVPPSVPVLPAYSPMLVLLIGLLLGLFVSVGAAFVAEYLDPSFRTPAEVNDVLKITVLASMPKKVA